VIIDIDAMLLVDTASMRYVLQAMTMSFFKNIYLLVWLQRAEDVPIIAISAIIAAKK